MKLLFELLGIVMDVVGFRFWDVTDIAAEVWVWVCAADVWLLNEFCGFIFDATVETAFTLNVVSAGYMEQRECKLHNQNFVNSELLLSTLFHVSDCHLFSYMFLILTLLTECVVVLTIFPVDNIFDCSWYNVANIFWSVDVPDFRDRIVWICDWMVFNICCFWAGSWIVCTLCTIWPFDGIDTWLLVEDETKGPLAMIWVVSVLAEFVLWDTVTFVLLELSIFCKLDVFAVTIVGRVTVTVFV